MFLKSAVKFMTIIIFPEIISLQLKLYISVAPTTAKDLLQISQLQGLLRGGSRAMTVFVYLFLEKILSRRT